MRKILQKTFIIMASGAIACSAGRAAAHDHRPCISGIYPHLAVTSSNNEVGIGAVVPWAGRIWATTYAPHNPDGSDDKLYEIDHDLKLTTRPESVGGTPANRMIHDESKQLIIGPYFIDRKRHVTAISPADMPGRLTACARHLSTPAHKVYFFTMENGLYEVDVNSKQIKTLYPDIQPHGDRFIFGYHGKGAYTGQKLLFVSNNGRTELLRSLSGPAGVLACWDGSLTEDFNGRYNPAIDSNRDRYATPRPPVPPKPGYMAGWHQICKVQHTEITGPGDIHGNQHDDDTIWTLGFDQKSVLLQSIENGKLRTWRLPKGSYCADGIHGWHTEWARIRRLKDRNPLSRDTWLMNMHGIFYDFPPGFSSTDFSGLQPLCDYVKIPVDYCLFNGQLVIGKNDASRFSNSFVPRAQSNFWFGKLKDLRNWGRPAGFGGVWLNDDIPANRVSPPFLVNGFGYVTLHLRHNTQKAVTIDIETSNGKGRWNHLSSITIPPRGYTYSIMVAPSYQWIRLRTRANTQKLTAYLMLATPYPHIEQPPMFATLADAGQNNNISTGLIRLRPEKDMQLELAAEKISRNGSTTTGYYRIGAKLQLIKYNNKQAESALKTEIAPQQIGGCDTASAWLMDGKTKLRLPKSLSDCDQTNIVCRQLREVVTERNLLNISGTFYEVPRDTAGGRRRLKPLTTHNKNITDFASWRGMLVFTGIKNGATNSIHVCRAADGAALWLGEIDDIWRMGEPRGYGGPWKNTRVKSGQPSDPYLMAGYDRKELSISHASDKTVTFIIEVDFLGDNTWSPYRALRVPPKSAFSYLFPVGFQAHWVRLTATSDTTATAQFSYGPTN